MKFGRDKNYRLKNRRLILSIIVIPLISLIFSFDMLLFYLLWCFTFQDWWKILYRALWKHCSIYSFDCSHLLFGLILRFMSAPSNFSFPSTVSILVVLCSRVNSFLLFIAFIFRLYLVNTTFIFYQQLYSAIPLYSLRIR